MSRAATNLTLLLAIVGGLSILVEPAQSAPPSWEGSSLSAGSYQEQALRLYRAQRFSEALPYFDYAIKLDGNRPQFYYWQAKCYRQLNDTTRAAASYRRIIEHFVGFPEVELAKAELLKLVASATSITTPGKDAKQSSTKQDGIKQDRSKEEANKQDASKQDVSKQDAAKHDASKQANVSKPFSSTNPSERPTVNSFASLEPTYKLIDLLRQRCYSEFDSQIQRSFKTEGKNPKLCYLAGKSWMYRCRLDLAEPFLLQAQKQGYNGWPGWDSTLSLLNQIENYKTFKPPFYKDFSEQGQLRIRLYAREDEWIHSVLPNFQKIIERAHALFGADLGMATIHILPQAQWYQNSLRTFNISPTVASHRDGCTYGTYAMICEISPTSNRDYSKDDPYWSTRTVMHEYTHCLIDSSVSSEILIPEWLHEGVAEYACNQFDPLFSVNAIKLLATCGKQSSPPVWQNMLDVQQDPSVRYSTSMLTIEELCKKGGPSTVGRIFARIRELNIALNKDTTGVDDRDDKQATLIEKAVQDVTGIRLSDAFARVIDHYWGKGVASATKK